MNYVFLCFIINHMSIINIFFMFYHKSLLQCLITHLDCARKRRDVAMAAPQMIVLMIVSLQLHFISAKQFLVEVDTKDDIQNHRARGKVQNKALDDYPKCQNHSDCWLSERCDEGTCSVGCRGLSWDNCQEGEACYDGDKIIKLNEDEALLFGVCKKIRK